MEVKSSLKYLRISPRKVRLLAELIKGLSVKSAEANLLHISKKSSSPLLKLLKSAIANAEHNFNLDKNNLFVKRVRVDEGPTLKRSRPRARGSAYPIMKKTSHIFLTLQEIKEKEIKAKKVIKNVDDKKIVENQKFKTKNSSFAKKTKLKQKEGKIIKKSVQKQRIFRRKSI